MNFRIARQFAKWNSSPNFPTIRYELPEIWAEPKDGEKPASLARAKKRVLDLNMWLQHFALYVGMLVPQSKELMAYVINTVKGSLQWAYRRQAAATGPQSGHR